MPGEPVDNDKSSTLSSTIDHADLSSLLDLRELLINAIVAKGGADIVSTIANSPTVELMGQQATGQIDAEAASSLAAQLDMAGAVLWLERVLVALVPALAEQKHFEFALDIARQLKTLTAPSIQLHALVLRVHLQQGDVEAAQAEFNAMLSLASQTGVDQHTNEFIVSSRAIMSFSQGEFSEAAQEFESAQSIIGDKVAARAAETARAAATEAMRRAAAATASLAAHAASGAASAAWRKTTVVSAKVAVLVAARAACAAAAACAAPAEMSLKAARAARELAIAQRREQAIARAKQQRARVRRARTRPHNGRNERGRRLTRVADDDATGKSASASRVDGHTVCTVGSIAVVCQHQVHFLTGEALRQTSSLGSWGEAKGRFKFPKGVAWSPDLERLYVCEAEQNRVQVFARLSTERGRPPASPSVLGIRWNGDMICVQTIGTRDSTLVSTRKRLADVSDAVAKAEEAAAKAANAVHGEGGAGEEGKSPAPSTEANVEVAAGAREVVASPLSSVSAPASPAPRRPSLALLHEAQVAAAAVRASEQAAVRALALAQQHKLSSPNAVCVGPALSSPNECPLDSLGDGGNTAGCGTFLFVADTGAHKVTAFDALSGRFALHVCREGHGHGQVFSPRGLVADCDTGRVFVADSGNHRVLLFAPSSQLQCEHYPPLQATHFCVQTREYLCARAVAEYAEDKSTRKFVCKVLDQPSYQVVADICVVGEVRLVKPMGLAVRRRGDLSELYVADAHRHTVEVFVSNDFAKGHQHSTTIGCVPASEQAWASDSTQRAAAGPPGARHSASALRMPCGVTFDAAGRVVVADTGNNRVAAYREKAPMQFEYDGVDGGANGGKQERHHHDRIRGSNGSGTDALNRPFGICKLE